MNKGCYNCRFLGKDLTSKEWIDHFKGLKPCRNWGKVYWWQRVIRFVRG